jgi:hypothetical protein
VGSGESYSGLESSLPDHFFCGKAARPFLRNRRCFVIMSDRPSQRPLTFADLAEAVGRFIFQWSALEGGLNTAIRESRGEGPRPSKVSGTLSERLEIWAELPIAYAGGGSGEAVKSKVREQVLNLRKIRNTILHGLIGGNSGPVGGGAFVECALGGHDNPSGETVAYTIEELEHFVQAIDSCRRAFLDLHAFNYELDPRYRTATA